MSRSLPVLDNVRIAAPCDKAWNAMPGDDRTRYCDACEKNVFNLVGMGHDDAMQLIHEKEGNLCVRLYQRSDGTLLTGDCPVGLRALRRKLRRAVGVVVACLTFLITVATFGSIDRVNRRRLIAVQPFSQLAKLVAPPPPMRMIMGRVRVRSQTPKPRSLPGRIRSFLFENGDCQEDER